MLVEYGDGKPDLNYKCRATALRRSIEALMAKHPSSKDDGLPVLNMVGCGNSLMIYYDGLQLPRTRLLNILLDMEKSFGDMSAAKFPNRRFRIPVTFKHKKIDAMMERYMTNQRSKASYLPDPFEFVAANNGLTTAELKKVLLGLESVVIGVGFFMALPESLPADPRHRLRAPKMNPSRTFTPAGTFSWGGSAIAVYPVDSPGGFMPLGMTLPGVDVYGSKIGFSETKPWMFEDMDLITYYEVSEEEYDRQMLRFRAGTYQFEYEDDVFDMEKHNILLRESEDEVQRTQARIATAQAEMALRENQLLEEWVAEKKSHETDPGELSRLLEGEYTIAYLRIVAVSYRLCPPLTRVLDPSNRVIEAPVNANVWKVLTNEGDTIRKGQTIAILEAMKMEINVNVEDDLDAAKVLKALIQPGQSVEAGQACVVVRITEKN